MDVMQLVGSLVAILLVAYLAKYLFPNATLLTIERAKRNLKRYCPDISGQYIESAHYYISKAGDSGVAIIPNGFGIVVLKQMGDRITVRHFEDLSDISIKETDNHIRISMDDFTLKSLNLKLNSEETAAIMSETNNTEGTACA